MTARLLSVNVGEPRDVEWRGERVRTAIWKTSVGDRSVRVAGVNLAGDDQADRRVHGGPDKAVYAYADEDYAYWRDAEGLETTPGLFGENLTLGGVDLRATAVGERWQVGTVVLEVSQPRLPCFKLAIRLGDPAFPRRFLAAGRVGAYLRVLVPGALRVGDVVQVVGRPTHGVTLGMAVSALRDRTLASAVLAAPELSAEWRHVLGR